MHLAADTPSAVAPASLLKLRHLEVEAGDLKSGEAVTDDFPHPAREGEWTT